MSAEIASGNSYDDQEDLEFIKDVRLEVKMKNNILWDKIHDRFPSVAAFCRANKKLGINAVQLGKLLLFKMYPFKQVRVGKTVLFVKEYRNICLSLETALCCPVEVLFPEELYERMMKVSTNTVIEISSFSNLTLPSKKEFLSFPSPEKDPISEVERRELGKRIEKVLETLTYREREIIKLLYGLGDDFTYTYEEVARIFKITRERVRQIEVKAIRKLQHPLRSRCLKSFLDCENKD